MKRSETILLATFGAVMLTLGVLVTGIFHPAPAMAGTADSGPGVVAVTGLSSSNQEVLYLFDGETKKLAVYQVNASGRLTMLAMRDTTFDLKPQEYGKNEPSVKDLKDLWKKHQEQTRTGAEEPDEKDMKDPKDTKN